MKRIVRKLKTLLPLLVAGSLLARCGDFNAAGGLLALAMEDNPGVVLPTIYDVYMNNSMNSTFIEGESSGAYTLVLASAPSDTVTVSISFNTSQITVNGSSTSPLDLTFTTADWNTIRTISVVPVNDGTAESYTPLTLTHSVSSTDTNFDGLTIPDINIALVDDDRVKRIFTADNGSTTVFDGDLGGVSGTDTLCNSSPAKPNGSTYKALLVDGSNRIACTTSNCSGGVSEHTGWVLSPYTIYTRSDGTTRVFITNQSGIFAFGTLTSSPTGIAGEYWTGLNNDWTTSSETCLEWSTTSPSYKGNSGYGSSTSNTAVNYSQPQCFKTNRIYCVEQ